MEINIHTGEKLTLDWMPSKYKTKAAAAKSLYKALCKACTECGFNPDYEVWIMNPEESKSHGYVTGWHVCWESGPYDWGCAAFVNGAWGYCETYWGFDLIFCD